MVPLTALWLPIILSAAAVFLVSSFLHMALKYHSAEYRRLPNEDHVLATLRADKPAPGFYAFPHAGELKDFKDEGIRAKFNQGPVGTMNVITDGPPAMGKALALWFLYSLLVGLFSAYVIGRTLGPGASWLPVFRFVGATAFMAYSFAHLSDGVWQQKPWSMTLKHVVDGLVYALVTGAVFGWLWP